MDIVIDRNKMEEMRQLPVQSIYYKLMAHPEVIDNLKFFTLLAMFESGVKSKGVDFLETTFNSLESSGQDKININAFMGLFLAYTKKFNLQ